jgi:hypothetical protein
MIDRPTCKIISELGHKTERNVGFRGLVFRKVNSGRRMRVAFQLIKRVDDPLNDLFFNRQFMVPDHFGLITS